MRWTISLAAVAASFVAPEALAQTISADAGKQDIVVTASRTGDIAGIAIADREVIARRQPASLIEVLDDLPGIRAFSTGGPAGGTFLSIRGGEPNFTTVMIDGVRLNDPTGSAGGAFDFALLDPSIVARVEVSRMSGSAIHGSDALSGVVQIVTRTPTQNGLRAGAQGWIDSRYGGAASASIAGGWAGGGVIASGARYDSGDGDPAGSLRRDQLFGRAHQQWGDFRLAALGLYTTTDGARFPEDSGGPLLAVIRTRERRSGDLSLGALSLARDASARIRPSLSISWSVQHGDGNAPPIAPGALDGVPATTVQDRFARFESIAALAGELGPFTLSTGGAILREEGSSTGTLDFGFPLPVQFARTRTTHSGFGEATLHASGGLTLGGAVRYDKLSGGSGNWTGRGSVRWETRPSGPALFAHLANGYKRPSLYALGHPLIGNASLAPETSRSLDLGIEVPVPGGQASLTLFDNRFRNLIDFDPVAFGLVNRARVGTRGAEGALALRLGHGWSAGGTLTYLSVESETPLRGRPAWSGNVRLSWERGAWRTDTTLRGNSDVNDSAVPTGLRVTPGHLEADAALAYRITSRLRIRATVRNLGDNRSWDAVGTPAPGRSLRLSIVLD